MTQTSLFYPTIPSGHQFSIKAPLSTRTPLFYPQTASEQKYSKSPIFDPSSSNFIQKSLQDINHPYKPHFQPGRLLFYQNLPSGYQFPLGKPIFPETSFIYRHNHLGKSFSLKAAFLPPRARYPPKRPINTPSLLRKMMVRILLRVLHRVPHMGSHGGYPRFYHYALRSILFQSAQPLNGMLRPLMEYFGLSPVIYEMLQPAILGLYIFCSQNLLRLVARASATSSFHLNYW